MLVVFDQVSSTNDVALEEAARAATSGSIVIANHQSNGRGQYGRRWESHDGLSLLMTDMLRRMFPPPTYEFPPNDAFFEITGVLQFVPGTVTSAMSIGCFADRRT